MTSNNGALNTADFNATTYHLTQLLIPHDKNPLYGMPTDVPNLNEINSWEGYFYLHFLFIVYLVSFLAADTWPCVLMHVRMHVSIMMNT